MTEVPVCVKTKTKTNTRRGMAYVYFPHLKSAMFLSRGVKVIGKIREQTF